MTAAVPPNTVVTSCVNRVKLQAIYRSDTQPEMSKCPHNTLLKPSRPPQKIRFSFCF